MWSDITTWTLLNVFQGWVYIKLYLFKMPALVMCFIQNLTYVMLSMIRTLLVAFRIQLWLKLIRFLIDLSRLKTQTACQGSPVASVGRSPFISLVSIRNVSGNLIFDSSLSYINDPVSSPYLLIFASTLNRDLLANTSLAWAKCIFARFELGFVLKTYFTVINKICLSFSYKNSDTESANIRFI